MNGLVLAGGKSSRLGQDKTALNFQGRTLLERTAALLQEHCGRVFISARSADVSCSGHDVILDATERIGPLGGIATALQHVGGPLLVLACDLPFMNSVTLNQLIAFHATRPKPAVLTTFLQTDTGFIESLVAIYEPEALPLLEQGITRKIYKLSRIIPDSLRHCLPYGSEHQHAFFNVNYPQDLDYLHTYRNSQPGFPDRPPR